MAAWCDQAPVRRLTISSYMVAEAKRAPPGLGENDVDGVHVPVPEDDFTQWPAGAPPPPWIGGAPTGGWAPDDGCSCGAAAGPAADMAAVLARLIGLARETVRMLAEIRSEIVRVGRAGLSGRGGFKGPPSEGGPKLQFAGDCFVCGQVGHRARACPRGAAALAAGGSTAPRAWPRPAGGEGAGADRGRGAGKAPNPAQHARGAGGAARA